MSWFARWLSSLIDFHHFLSFAYSHFFCGIHSCSLRGIVHWYLMEIKIREQKWVKNGIASVAVSKSIVISPFSLPGRRERIVRRALRIQFSLAFETFRWRIINQDANNNSFFCSGSSYFSLEMRRRIRFRSAQRCRWPRIKWAASTASLHIIHQTPNSINFERWKLISFSLFFFWGKNRRE